MAPFHSTLAVRKVLQVAIFFIVSPSEKGSYVRQTESRELVHTFEETLRHGRRRAWLQNSYAVDV